MTVPEAILTMTPKVRERFTNLPPDIQHTILRLREQPDPREDPRERLELRLFEMRERNQRKHARAA
jgi:hypothetical protein